MIKIADSHTDAITELSKNNFNSYMNNLNVKGIICCAVFTNGDNFNINKLLMFYNILKSVSNKNVKFAFSIEDLTFLKDSNDLEQIIKLDPISCSLTWNYNNQFGGGASENKGLTKEGKVLIKTLEENNVLIDTAHLNKKSFWQFVKLTSKPIYKSHINVYSLKKHKRNLTNKQIKAIVESNGFLGLTIYSRFINSKGISSKDVAKQFDYLIKNFGYKNFGLGTDFYGFNFKYAPRNVKNYKQISNIAKELKKLGYSRKIINCLLWKNYYNFLKRTKQLIKIT